MQRVKRHVLLGVALLVLLGCGAAMAQSTKPLLGDMDAVNIALQAVEPRYGPAPAIAGMGFDGPSREWRVHIDRGEGKTPRALVVIVSEITGKVCAREPAVDGCLVQADASNPLKDARKKRAALDEAMNNPPPDLQGVMMALIRYQAATQGAYLNANMGHWLYVSMQSPTQDKPIDLSAQAIRSLKDVEIAIFPGSAWTPPKDGVRVGRDMAMGVRLPTRRSDGNYDVQYGFICGSLCGSGHTAVLRHDATGWHVVSSFMDFIS